MAQPRLLYGSDRSDESGSREAQRVLMGLQEGLAGWEIIEESTRAGFHKRISEARTTQGLWEAILVNGKFDGSVYHGFDATNAVVRSLKPLPSLAVHSSLVPEWREQRPRGLFHPGEAKLLVKALSWNSPYPDELPAWLEALKANSIKA